MAKTNGRSTPSSVSAVRQDLARLRSDMNYLMATVGRINLSRNATRTAGRIWQDASRAYSRLSHRAQRYGRSMERQISSHPLEAAAIAAVAGVVVIGAFMGRMIGRSDR